MFFTQCPYSEVLNKRSPSPTKFSFSMTFGRPAVWRSGWPSIQRPTIQPFDVHSNVRTPNRPTVQPSNCPTIRPSDCRTVRPSGSVRPSDRLTVRPFDRPTVQPPLRRNVHPPSIRRLRSPVRGDELLFFNRFSQQVVISHVSQ